MILLVKESTHYQAFVNVYNPYISPNDRVNLNHHKIKPLSHLKGFIIVDGAKRDFDLISQLISFDQAINIKSLNQYYLPTIRQLLKQYGRLKSNQRFESSFYVVSGPDAYHIDLEGYVRPIFDIYFHPYTDLAVSVWTKYQKQPTQEKIQRLLDLYCLDYQSRKEFFVGYDGLTEKVSYMTGSSDAF
jgi:hypothetical protein